jgi:hypothetical protein
MALASSVVALKKWRRCISRKKGFRLELLGALVPVVTRVNSTNILDEGLRIGGAGRRMNLKVKSVKQGVYRE